MNSIVLTLSAFVFLILSSIPLTAQVLLPHRFGAGASFADGDGLTPSLLFTCLYEYRFNHWFGLEADLNMFQSNDLEDALAISPPPFPNYRMRHITSLDITANFSPFGIPWNYLQISVGGGIRRFTGFQNTLTGTFVANGMQQLFVKNFYHDELEPYIVGRLNYDVPLGDHLSLGIRVGLAINRTFNGNWIFLYANVPSSAFPDHIPQYSWNNGFSHIGCNLKVSL